jgi:anthranilate synthase component 1
MKPEQFIELAQQPFTRIPVYREILADCETPLSAYLKLANDAYSYLFESVQGGEKWGRYSIIGLHAHTVLSVRDQDITIAVDGKISEQHNAADPLAFIKTFQARYRIPQLEHLPRFNGGLVGYFGYDTVRYVEPKLKATTPPDTIGTPDIVLMVSDEVVVFDNLRGTLWLITHADPRAQDAYELAQQRLDQLQSKLQQPIPYAAKKVTRTVAEGDFKSGFTQADFEQAVTKIKNYILAGDVMQVVISQRMTVPVSAAPLDIYRALRHLNPSPYLYFLHLDDFHIVGSSPEILVRLEEGEITVRPIAGTRKRGKTAEEDHDMELDLMNDPKEIAEHLMLIDLGRNDVGRVSQTGSVTLTEKMQVERYSHVMHIVSNVVGKIKKDLDAIDALRATLPAGTLSGAPKIRAMEIIDELEPVKRGVYGGAVGYLSWHGNMDTAIAIRTAVIKDGLLHIQAGAGVVADSVPALEWKETMNKGRAIFKAVEMAEKGLDLLD